MKSNELILNYFFVEKPFIRTKITVKVNKSEPNIQCSHAILNLDNSSKKNEIQKNLFNFELYAGRAF